MMTDHVATTDEDNRVKRSTGRSRLAKFAAVAVASVGLAVGPATAANAWTHHLYKSTSTPLASSYAHGSAVTTIESFSMLSCSSGFTKKTTVQNGPGVVDGHYYQGNGCPGIIDYGHGHPSSYATCRSVTTTGNHYANCYAGY